MDLGEGCVEVYEDVGHWLGLESLLVRGFVYRTSPIMRLSVYGQDRRNQTSLNNRNRDNGNDCIAVSPFLHDSA